MTGMANDRVSVTAGVPIPTVGHKSRPSAMTQSCPPDRPADHPTRVVDLARSNGISFAMRRTCRPSASLVRSQLIA